MLDGARGKILERARKLPERQASMMPHLRLACAREYQKGT